MRRRARGIGKLHELADVLVAQGFTVREAHTILNAMFDAMKAALKRREDVELPFGTLRVVANMVQPYRRWYMGKPVEFYRKRYRIEFMPPEDKEAHGDE